MRLFSYYVLHTFKNQLKKLFRTWVLIFLVVCMAFGVGIGLFAGYLTNSADERIPEEQVQEEASREMEEEAAEGDLSFLTDGVSAADVAELAAGGIILFFFVFYALSADKNGSRIFLPADVNLLFASPMKPQSVLMFRVATQLGMALAASLYMLIQVPNLTMGAGLSVWSALALVLAWCLVIVSGMLLQVLLYTLSATYPVWKRFLRRGIYGLLAVIAGGYLCFAAVCGEGYLQAAVRFFNAKFTRLIPFWGWLKWLCVSAIMGDAAGVLVCLAALVLGTGLLVLLIWRLHADFYEDAMAKSEETAELLAAAQSERSGGVILRRKKDRSEKLRRDGLGHGAGANIFFFKTMYNRFRFAHFGFLTKTMEFYLVAAAGVALLSRFVFDAGSVLPVALTLCVLVFFRSLGNPLERDTGLDFFVMIPESTWAKLFWSLLGGTADCFLDVLPAVLLGAALLGAPLLPALLWVPLIVSVDFYATSVGAFIGLSVPVSAGKMVKQLVQILFIYFGLVPDIALAAVGFAFDTLEWMLPLAAFVNVVLGLLFFGLSPIFLDPKGGKVRRVVPPFEGDLGAVRRQFSRLGLGVFVIFAVAAALQIAAGWLVDRVYPAGDFPSWVLWLATFAPMYLAAVPAGLLVMRRVPAVPREQHALGAGRFFSAGVICVFLMYAGNIVGILLLTFIQALFGISSANPLLSYTADDSLFFRVLVMVILAPLIEEYVFRKALIDRMHVYGEGLAAFTSALIFGLFHGNLSQFFYAFALGLVFGYLYLRTGRLRYSAALHMFINFMGGILAPELLNHLLSSAFEETGASHLTMLFRLLPLLAFVGAVLLLALAGLVLFCIRIREVHFPVADLELPRGQRFRTVCGNPGMLLFAAGALASIALSFAA